jgi:acetyltransferase-like isoleucine patch superfamily enzyme
MSLKKLAKYIFNLIPIRLQCLIQSVRVTTKMVVGRGSYIHPTVHLLGKNHIRVGANSCISEGCWFNVNHRNGNNIAINIGNNCFIGKQNFFTSGDIITIGDYALTTIGCRFIGSTHIINVPDEPYLLTGTTSGDKIEIGVNCFIGAGATVLGNVKIGHGSVIGATSLVLSDIPPFSIAIGNPAKVIKRYSFVQKAWVPVSEITLEDEASMPSEQEYLIHLKANFPHICMPWIAAGKSMGDL